MEKTEVVILCGSKGVRLSEETINKPKPMVEIGGKPILWHIMKIYSHFGYNQFVLALGYKGDYIKKYFYDYRITSSDFTLLMHPDYSPKIHNVQGDTDREIQNWIADSDIEYLESPKYWIIERRFYYA